MLKLTAIAISLLLTACASTDQTNTPPRTAQPLEPYEPIPIVKNDTDDDYTLLSRTTYLRQFQCGLIADVGRTANRYSGLDQVKEHADKLSNCKAHALNEVDDLVAKISKLNSSDSMLNAVKTLYSSWGLYIKDLSVYSYENQDFKNKYTAAEEAYNTELKFRK